MGSRYMMLGPLKPSHIHEVIFSQKQVKTLIFYTQSISNQPLSSLLSQLHKPKREYFKLVEFRTSCKQVCAQDLFFFSWSGNFFSRAHENVLAGRGKFLTAPLIFAF